MSRRGFTLMEAVIAIVVIGVVLAIGLPRANDWVRREAVRGARRQLVTHLAQARYTAIQRGCPAVLHLDQSNARVWVTACTLQGGGSDTVGALDYLSSRFGVGFASDRDSLAFTPQGLALATASLQVVFSRGTDTASLTITPAGRPSW